MKLQDLSAPSRRDQIDTVGGVIALDPGTTGPAVAARFDKLVAPLVDQGFWTAAVQEGAYRPQQGLWAPQRRAVGLALAYLAAGQEGLLEREAALVKMPTGTGKTAVIATLACALHEIRRTLVITPRKALVEQMIGDLHARLWRRFGLIYENGKLRDRVASDLDPTDSRIAAAAAVAGVEQLLPSRASELLKGAKNDRHVLVGTFPALEQILRPERPAHRVSGRKPRSRETTPSDAVEQTDVPESDLDALAQYLRTFDLVIVDEGHYEPAFIWSQCIRSLARPTVLFSATPYRNDFRYFSVTGRFAFSLNFEEAEEERLVRAIRFVRSGPGSIAQELDQFYRTVVQPAFVGPGVPKVIVRARDHATLMRLRNDIARELKDSAVIIHHAEGKNDPKQRRFNSATAAIRAPETANARFWLHQWKLLEGVDDASFAGVVVHDTLADTRAVVQQIGRIIRYNGDRNSMERGFILTLADASDMEARFERYRKFEAYFDKGPAEALSREARLPEVLLNSAPEIQYVFGDFRERPDFDQLEGVGAFQAPRRATIFRNLERRSLDELADMCVEAMGLEERYNVRIFKPDADEPQNVRVLAYLTWRNAELLSRHALPLWDFGLMILVTIENRVLVLDTDGLIVDIRRLGLEPEPLAHIQRLAPQFSQREASRISQASTVSLDLSELAVRSTTARMRNFNEGFYDLAEQSQAVTAVRAYLKDRNRAGIVRYLSLHRATVSDSIQELVSVPRYVEWATEIANDLDRRVKVAPVFARFATSLPAPPEADAQPRNLLLDFAEILDDNAGRPAGWSQMACDALLHADLCIDVKASGEFELAVGGVRIAGTLHYEITGQVRRQGRYVVESEALDKYVLAEAGGEARPKDTPSLVQMINRSQAMRVVPKMGDLVYAQRHFYRPGIDFDAVREGRSGRNPLEQVVGSKWLEAVKSEKGKATDSLQTWATDSIFGAVYSHFGWAAHGKADPQFADAIRGHDPDFAATLDAFDIVICDDGGTEYCDFLCVDTVRRRVALLHAKVDDTVLSMTALQVVGRQAMASLAFIVRNHPIADRDDFWRTPVSIKDGYLSRRVLKGPPGDLSQIVRDALLSATYTREIWILSGRSLSVEALRDAVKQPPYNAQRLQLLYYIAALQTSIARANVRLRFFCSP